MDPNKDELKAEDGAGSPRLVRPGNPRRHRGRWAVIGLLVIIWAGMGLYVAWWYRDSRPKDRQSMRLGNPAASASAAARPVGSFVFNSDTPEAILLVDGHEAGALPVLLRLGDNQPRQVVVNAPGCQPWTARLDPQAANGKTVALNLTLEPLE